MKYRVIIVLFAGVISGCSTTNETPDEFSKTREIIQPIPENDQEHFTKSMYFNSDIKGLVPVVLKIPRYPADAYMAKIQGSCNVSFNLFPKNPQNAPNMGLYGTSNIIVTSCHPVGYFEESCLTAAKEWYFAYNTHDKRDIGNNVVRSVCTYKIPGDSIGEDSGITEVLAPSEIGKFKNMNSAPPFFLSVDQYIRYEMESNTVVLGVDVLVYRRPAFSLNSEVDRIRYSISSAFPDSIYLIEEEFVIEEGDANYKGFHLQTKSRKKIDGYEFMLIKDSYVFDLERSYISFRFTTFDDTRDSVEEDIRQFMEEIFKHVRRN